MAAISLHFVAVVILYVCFVASYGLTAHLHLLPSGDENSNVLGLKALMLSLVLGLAQGILVSPFAALPLLIIAFVLASRMSRFNCVVLLLGAQVIVFIEKLWIMHSASWAHGHWLREMFAALVGFRLTIPLWSAAIVYWFFLMIFVRRTRKARGCDADRHCA